MELDDLEKANLDLLAEIENLKRSLEDADALRMDMAAEIVTSLGKVNIARNLIPQLRDRSLDLTEAQALFDRELHFMGEGDDTEWVEMTGPRP